MSKLVMSSFSHSARRMAQPLILDKGIYTPGRYSDALIAKALTFIAGYLNEREPMEMMGPDTVQSVQNDWGYLDPSDYVDLARGFGFRPELDDDTNSRLMMDYLDDSGVWLDAMLTMATELDESQFVWSSNREPMTRPRTNYGKKYQPKMDSIRGIVERMIFDLKK